jgi:hypothetical protein
VIGREKEGKLKKETKRKSKQKKKDSISVRG